MTGPDAPIPAGAPQGSPACTANTARYRCSTLDMCISANPGPLTTDVRKHRDQKPITATVKHQVGRTPEDVSRAGRPYDIDSPPRKIEVKAFGGSARGAEIPLEERQVDEARRDPDNYYVYVVDNVARRDHGEMAVRVIHGAALQAVITGAKRYTTYWSTFRVGEYDDAERLLPPDDDGSAAPPDE